MHLINWNIASKKRTGIFCNLHFEVTVSGEDVKMFDDDPVGIMQRIVDYGIERFKEEEGIVD